MRREGSTVEYYTTPVGEYGGGELTTIPKNESYATDYCDGTLGFYDSTFDKLVVIGDGSFVNKDSVGDGAEVAERFIVELWKYGGLSSTTRQLGDTEARSIKPGIGRWSRAQHQITSVIAAVEFGCSAQQVMVMAFHDEAHLLGSHDTEVLFQPKNMGNHHDLVLGMNGERSGFFDHLRNSSLVEGNRFKGLDMTLDDLVKEEDSRGILCQPQGNMEIDRFYIATEGNIWAAPKDEMQESIRYIKKYHDLNHGEQLVFTSVDAAILWARVQARLQAENWAEPVRFTVSELSNLQIKFGLSSAHSDFDYLTHAHPSDTLYVVHEDHQAHIQQAATNHGFISATNRIIDAIVAQQRPVQARYNFKNPYRGPEELPGWLYMGQARLNVSDVQHSKIETRGGSPTNLVIELREQKDRFLNPFIKIDGINELVRAYDIDKVRDHIQDIKINGNKARRVVIDLDRFRDIDGNPLSPEDKRALSNGLRLIKHKWEEVLGRRQMTKEQFTMHMQQQNARYKNIGRVVLARDASIIDPQTAAA